MISSDKIILAKDVVQDMNENANYVYEICKQILFLIYV